MKIASRIAFSVLVVLAAGCAKKTESQTEAQAPGLSDNTAYKVTFLEFGSTTCIPCQQMVAVMKAVEETYGHEVKVVFNDVKSDSGATLGRQYGIQLIPTQVLLNDQGEEVFRHQGFIPFEDLAVELKKLGVEAAE